MALALPYYVWLSKWARARQFCLVCVCVCVIISNLFTSIFICTFSLSHTQTFTSVLFLHSFQSISSYALRDARACILLCTVCCFYSLAESLHSFIRYVIVSLLHWEFENNQFFYTSFVWSFFWFANIDTETVKSLDRNRMNVCTFSMYYIHNILISKSMQCFFGLAMWPKRKRLANRHRLNDFCWDFESNEWRRCTLLLRAQNIY